VGPKGAQEAEVWRTIQYEQSLAFFIALVLDSVQLERCNFDITCLLSGPGPGKLLDASVYISAIKCSKSGLQHGDTTSPILQLLIVRSQNATVLSPILQLWMHTMIDVVNQSDVSCATGGYTDNSTIW